MLALSVVSLIAPKHGETSAISKLLITNELNLLKSVLGVKLGTPNNIVSVSNYSGVFNESVCC